MNKNLNISPRALTDKEKADRANDIYDSFANYLSFCPRCNYVDKTNMYLARAEARVKQLCTEGKTCPNCGESRWLLGYPLGSTTGFVQF